MIKPEVRNCNMILNEQQERHLHYNYVDKYEYLTGQEILPTQQLRQIQDAKFSYSSLVNAFEMIEKRHKKQVEGLKSL